MAPLVAHGTKGRRSAWLCPRTGGMAFAYNYTRYSNNHIQDQNSNHLMMTMSPPISQTQPALALSPLKETLLEPLLFTVVGLFWLIALPAGALFSVAVTAYDELASLKSRALRMPYLRSNAAANPLILRPKSFARRNASFLASIRNKIVGA